MASTLRAFSENEFERDRERWEAEKRRKLVRRDRKNNRDLVSELESPRQGRCGRPEDEDYLDDEDLDMNGDYDPGDLDWDEFSDRFERGLFDD
jgi:hypothetical protein